MKKVLGVGINDADYKVTRYEGCKQVWICPFYIRWKSMIARCYDKSYIKINPTYIDCSVCESWLTFSIFRKWMESQDWNGKYLDKDLLKRGNKVYCPEYCIFVDREVNNFIVEKVNNGLLPGVHYEVSRNRYRASINGASAACFDTEIAAHNCWRKHKVDFAFDLAGKQKDPKVAEAILRYYE